MKVSLEEVTVPDQEISILIVDDQATIRSLLTEILSPRYRCVGVERASEALRLMQLQHFRIALIDLGLPGMSGLSLCRLVTNQSPRTAVIVVSGQTDKKSIDEALEAGASGFLAKPFTLREAMTAVERVLERHSPGAVA